MKSFLVARPYLVVVININILTMGALVTLEMKLKSRFLLFFEGFSHVSSCLSWHKPLAWDTHFDTTTSSMYIFSRVVSYFHDIKL